MYSEALMQIYHAEIIANYKMVEDTFKTAL